MNDKNDCMKDTYARVATIISVLIFALFIPLALLNETTGWIPDLVVFILLTLFYYWTWDTWRLTLPIFTIVILGHITHAMGVFGWYSINPGPIQYDHITHLLGSIGIALITYRFISQFMDEKPFTKKNLLLLGTIFFAASGVGAIVELSEFLGYLFLGFGDAGALFFGAGDGVIGLEGTDLMDAIGGGWINLGWDLTYNTLGVLIGMSIMWISHWWTKKEDEPLHSEVWR